MGTSGAKYKIDYFYILIKIIMVNYQLGKVYKLVSSQTNDIYIGSTCQSTLANRLCQHKIQYRSYLNGNQRKYISSIEILQYDDVQIVLIEDYPCERKEQLTCLENYHIERNREIAVNMKRAFTGLSRKEFKRQYYQDNKEDLSVKNREYVEEHREQVCAYKKQWHEENRERIIEEKRRHYDENKEEINQARRERRAADEYHHEVLRAQKKEYYERNKEKMNAKVVCDNCGVITTGRCLARHKKSKKCLSLSKQY